MKACISCGTREDETELRDHGKGPECHTCAVEVQFPLPPPDVTLNELRTRWPDGDWTRDDVGHAWAGNVAGARYVVVHGFESWLCFGPNGRNARGETPVKAVENAGRI